MDCSSDDSGVPYLRQRYSIMGRVNWFGWCTSPYSRDIHDFLKEKELTRPAIAFMSPQANQRLDLVDWIRKTAETCKFSIPCVHLAVYILDQFMDTHNITPQCVGTVGAVCLWIASKYEHAVKVPRVQFLISQSESTFGHKIHLIHAVRLERFILHLLHYRLELPTAAHFAEYYRLFAVLKGDRNVSIPSHSKLLKRVRLSFDILLDRSLQFVDLVNKQPSIVAAGCLLGARIINVVTPAWPDLLQTVTGWAFDDVGSVANFLMLLCDINLDSDMGYSSSPDSRLRASLGTSCTTSPTS